MYLLRNEDGNNYIGGKNCNYDSGNNYLTCTSDGKYIPKLYIYSQYGYFLIKLSNN